MKELSVTITGFWNYQGLLPFTIGTFLTCEKEPFNPHDDEAIKVLGPNKYDKVGYIANSPKYKANGTMSAGKVGHYVKDRFTVQVLFVTSSKVICRVVDGLAEEEF